MCDFNLKEITSSLSVKEIRSANAELCLSACLSKYYTILHGMMVPYRINKPKLRSLLQYLVGKEDFITLIVEYDNTRKGTLKILGTT